MLLLGFRDVPERNDVGAFSRAKWSDKFKTVFDITDPEFKTFYDRFLGLAKYRRNPAAHGNTNTVFDFYLNGARHKLSVLIMDSRLSMHWHDQSINFDLLDSFLKLLKTHASTKNIFAYISEGFNVSFLPDTLSMNDEITTMPKRELRDYFKYEHRRYDDASNMDW